MSVLMDRQQMQLSSVLPGRGLRQHQTRSRMSAHVRRRHLGLHEVSLFCSCTISAAKRGWAARGWPRMFSITGWDAETHQNSRRTLCGRRGGHRRSCLTTLEMRQWLSWADRPFSGAPLGVVRAASGRAGFGVFLGIGDGVV